MTSAALEQLFRRLLAGPASLAEIVDLCGCPLHEIENEISVLSDMGYRFERGETLSLVQRPNLLVAEEILAGARRTSDMECPWRVLVFRETASSSDVVAREAAAGAAPWLAVFAESQTAGRGRHGRVWQSRPGIGLWFSVLLDAGLMGDGPAKITASVAVAVAEAIESLCPVHCGIKWPNDLWIREKKVCGILTEATASGGRVQSVVAGIGVNVGHGAEDFEGEVNATATSLRLECGGGEPPRRAELASAILTRLCFCLAEPFESVRQRWEERCLTLGRAVTIETATGFIHGTVEAMDEEGCLIVRDDYGLPRVVRAGEVLHAPV